MLSSKNVMPNLFEFSRKKFNGNLTLMTDFITEAFEKANLMHHIINCHGFEDIKLTYEETCRLAEKSNIPLDQLLN